MAVRPAKSCLPNPRFPGTRRADLRRRRPSCRSALRPLRRSGRRQREARSRQPFAHWRCSCYAVERCSGRPRGEPTGSQATALRQLVDVGVNPSNSMRRSGCCCPSCLQAGASGKYDHHVAARNSARPWPDRLRAAPHPAATISTIEMTPQAMPNMVRAVRSLWPHKV